MRLDVGCGDRPRGNVNVDIMQFTDYFGKRRMDVKAIPNFVKASVMALPFRPATFETVYCFHTLEHTKDVIHACMQLAGVARKKLFLVVPWWIHEKPHNRLIFIRRKWANKAHKHAFGFKELRKILKFLFVDGVKVSWSFKFVEALKFRSHACIRLSSIFWALLDLFPPFPSILIARVTL